MPELPIVRDHMDTRVPTVSPDTEILDAIDFLLKHRVTGAPVVDAADNLVGMLTERDCLGLVATGVDADRPRGTIASFMTTEVITIQPDMDAFQSGTGRSVRNAAVEDDSRHIPAIQHGDAGVVRV